MEDKLLEKLIREWNERLIEIDDFEKKKNRLDFLLNNTLVKEYKALQKEIDNSNQYTRNLTKEERLYYLFMNDYAPKIEVPLNIYVYNGTFKVVKSYDIERPEPDMRVSKNDPTADYSNYINLETGSEFFVPIKDREIFERKNRIIFPSTSHYTFWNYYDQIRQEYINDCIKYGQKEAVNRVLTKGKK